MTDREWQAYFNAVWRCVSEAVKRDPDLAVRLLAMRAWEADMAAGLGTRESPSVRQKAIWERVRAKYPPTKDMTIEQIQECYEALNLALDGDAVDALLRSIPGVKP